MARPRRGTIVKTRTGRLQAMLTLANGKRYRLPKGGWPRGTSRAFAEEKAAFWSQQVAERGITRPEQLTGEAPVAKRVKPSESIEPWLVHWLKVRADKGQTSGPEVEGHLRNHVLPAIQQHSGVESKHVKDWTEDDVRAVSRALAAKVEAKTMSAKTAMNVWVSMRAALRDARKSNDNEQRVRTDDPAANVEGPSSGAKVETQVFYPSEATRFMACENVPLAWARLFALHTYLGPRTGELSELRWADIDLEHGTVRIHRARDRRREGQTKAPKTKRERKYAFELVLLPLLLAMHAESDGQGKVLPTMPEARSLSASFRRYLLKAGIDRPELHDKSETSRPARLYDCRHSYATWRVARRDTLTDIQHAMGHTSITTTEGYVKLASAMNIGPEDSFPGLPARLLGEHGQGTDTGEDTSQSHAANARGAVSAGDPTGHPGVTPEARLQPPNTTEPTPTSEAQSVGAMLASVGSAHETAHDSDSVEVALARALDAASAAGRWDVVAQLARELEARRQAAPAESEESADETPGKILRLAARRRKAR